MKKLLSLLLAGAMACTLALPALAEETANYDDQIMLIDDDGAAALGGAPADGIFQPEESQWWTDYARELVNRGVMQGTDKGFEGEGIVTRGTLFQTLYNLEGRPQGVKAPYTFHDVEGKWYETAASWALEAGLTQGTGDNQFYGDKPITRSEIVTALYRHAQHKGQITAIVADIFTYADVDEVAGWALPAFQWAVGAGVMNGKDGNRLAPGDTATRGELAKLLAVYLQQPAAQDPAGEPGGEPAQKPAEGEEMPPQGEDPKTPSDLVGRAADITKYGYVTTDISVDAAAAAGLAVGDLLTVSITGQEPFTAPYGVKELDVPQGEAVVLADASGVLALTLNRGDFATDYGVGVRNPGGSETYYTLTPEVEIGLALAEQGGYAAQLELLDLDARTNDLSDYDSKEAFANFRAVTGGDLAEGVLYRTSSPINPALGRAACADELLRAAGVRTVVNLTDCIYRGRAYEGFDGTYYATLAADGGVVYLNMRMDMDTQESISDLKNGLEFLIERPGPYAIHSAEGTDRTGYLAMLLEALMGASYQDILADYMMSYQNYYHVAPGTEQWSKIGANNMERDVLRLAGVRDLSALDTVDLAQRAETYLVETLGLTREQVETLKSHLSTPLAGADSGT